MMNQKHFQKVQLGSHYFCVAMKERREALGISCRELAKRIGTSSRTYLSEVESGKMLVSLDLGLLICQVLNIPLYFLTDYIEKGNVQRQNRLLDTQYLEWLKSTPEHIIEEVLGREESLKKHFEIIERVTKQYEHDNTMYSVL